MSDRGYPVTADSYLPDLRLHPVRLSFPTSDRCCCHHMRRKGYRGQAEARTLSSDDIHGGHH